VSSHAGISQFRRNINGNLVESLISNLPGKRCYAMHFDFQNQLWFENFEQLFSFDGKKLTVFPDSEKEFGVKINHITQTKDSIMVI
jgi:hypothetical protein